MAHEVSIVFPEDGHAHVNSTMFTIDSEATRMCV